jgi:hypothetical protein
MNERDPVQRLGFQDCVVDLDGDLAAARVQRQRLGRLVSSPPDSTSATEGLRQDSSVTGRFGLQHGGLIRFERIDQTARAFVVPSLPKERGDPLGTAHRRRTEQS